MAAKAPARQSADRSEAPARQSADRSEAPARQSADRSEAPARQSGDRSESACAAERRWQRSARGQSADGSEAPVGRAPIVPEGERARPPLMEKCSCGFDRS
jgi:hypothetical protein